jgi:hypothetical protein
MDRKTRWLTLLVITFAVVSPAHAYQHSYSEYYRSKDGSIVHRPTRGNVDYGHVTAVCGDGSQSFSHHHQGTCSHHGGVANWR